MSQLDSKVKGASTPGRTNAFGNLPVGADGDLLVAAAAQASGVKFDPPSAVPGVGVGLGGLWFYGDGSDGNFTLVGNTTLAFGDNVKNYLNLTLAGFTLTCDVLDRYFVIYVKGTLAGGGGTVSVQGRGPGSANLGGAGGVAGGTAGTGGSGGDGPASIYVFAKKIGGVTLTAGGAAGVDGTDGTVVGFVAGAGTTGIPASNENMTFLFRLFGPVLPIHQGDAFGTPGNESALSAANQVIVNRTTKDTLRLILLSGVGNYGSPFDMRVMWAAGGAGGGGGNANVLLVPVDGGGGAGGGLGVIGSGGAGGSAFALATGSGNKASGGGGGAGGAGGAINLICDEVTSAISLQANGGNGGNGGDGAADGAGVATGGGGGGGGGAGIAIAIVTVGSGFVTTLVTGGTAGVGGTSAGSATPGNNGVAGGAGYAATLLKT